ncbi:MAG TPA: glycosyltransferase family 2 protein [Ktedonobacterales bacterium]|nr:glycosyltransferase family 2 protein [Ktedonobacterales bacterium]
MVDESPIALMTRSQSSADDPGAFWRDVYAGGMALARSNRWVAEARLREVVTRQLAPLAKRAIADAAPNDQQSAASQLALAMGRWRTALDAAQSVGDLTQAYAAVVDDYLALEAAVFPQPATPDAPLMRRETQELIATLLAHPPTLSPDVITQQSVSIVLPAYNEEIIIGQTVRACIETAERFCPNVEVLVVNDGSRDGTGAVLDALAHENAAVRPLHHVVNRGYGAALLTGFGAAQGDYLFFMDSDGQFAIEDIALLLQQEAAQPGVVVLGYRKHRQDSFMRRLNAWGWKRLVGIVLGLHGIRDIDCAFKLFPTRLVQVCNVTAQGAMVNTELLVKLRKMRVPMVQLPVRHFPRVHGSATGANLRVIVKAFQEMIRLRLRLHEWRAPTLPPTLRSS